MTSKCISAFILIYISTVATLQAQHGVIQGSVTTRDGQPAAHVSVTIKGEHKGAVTEADGSFSIKNVTEGAHIVIASFVGLEKQEKQVNVINGEITQVDFVLEESAQQLSEVVVTAGSGLNEKTLTIGKAAINPMDLPQSIVTINKSVLNQQQALRLGDVLMNMSGIYLMGTTGGTQEEIAGRGFSYGSSNTFKNGVRYNNSVMPEVSALDRVEVMKGSNAILFGNVAAGGILNLVTKKPRFERGGEVSFRMGSYDFYKPALDIYGSLNNSKTVAYRLNTSYEKAQSFRDNVKSQRYYINPSFLVKVGRKTEILAEGDYLNDDRTSDFGVGAINYSLPDLPRSRFLGASWSYNKAEQKSVTITVSHRLNDRWKLTGIAAHQAYENNLYGTARPNASSRMIAADGTWMRTLQRSRNNEMYQIAQIDLTGNFKTRSVEHQLLIGADRDGYNTDVTAFTILTNPNNLSNVVYDTINVFTPNQYKQRSDIPQANENTITNNRISRVGVYVQDLVSLTEKLKLLAGIRYSYIETRSQVLTVASGQIQATAPLYDDAFTPRFGLVYKPHKSISTFVSYANSFNVNSGIDNTGKALRPSFINQFEAGVKNELFNGLLSANITAYNIVNSNLAQTILSTSPDYNPTYPTAQELAGEVTSKGIELDIMSKSYRGFSVIAGYSYNDTRYTNSNIYQVNSLLRYNPSHTANMSMYYQFASNSSLKGFSLGAMSYYVGSRVAGRSTRLTVANDTYKLMPLPDYFLFDLSAGYSIQNISIRFKVSNLLNALSYNVHDDNSINPIAPRQLAATISYKL